MAGATIVQEDAIVEIELGASESKDLDRLAEETRKSGVKWDDLKAELGL